MKRVLFVENYGDIIGGGQRSLLVLMRRLDRQRYAPLCVCPFDGTMASALRQAEIEVRIAPQPPLRAATVFAVLAAVWHYYTLVRREGVALLHANGSRCMFYAGIAGKMAGIPVVWHVRITAADGWWDRILSMFARRIVAISKAVWRRFSWSTRSDDVRIIYNGEELERYEQAEASRGRAEFEAEDGYLIGMVARLTEEKDYETYLLAAAEIEAQLGQVHFLAVGEDLDPRQERLNSLRRLTEELGLGNKVIFTGQRDDMPQIMAAMDVLVHCAHSEAFGRVLVEAMASGTPAVATAVGGIPEVIVHGETGLLVEAGDHVAVGRAVVGLLCDAERRANFAWAGKRRAQTHFSIEGHVARLQGLYDEILELER